MKEENKNNLRQYGKLETEKRKENSFFHTLLLKNILNAMTEFVMTLTSQILEMKDEDTDGFSFILRVMENNTDLKVVDLYPDIESKYKGKGISIAIILHVRDKFQKRIISSSNNLSDFDENEENPLLSLEFNSPSAIKMYGRKWKKMA